MKNPVDLTSHDSMPGHSSQAPVQSRQKAYKIFIFTKHVENCWTNIHKKVIRSGQVKITAEIKLRGPKGNTHTQKLSLMPIHYLNVFQILHGLVHETGAIVLSHIVKSLSNPDHGLHNICIHIWKTNFTAGHIYIAITEQEVYLRQNISVPKYKHYGHQTPILS